MFSIHRVIGLSSVLFVLSACGGGGSSGDSGGQTPPPTPTYTVATSVTGSGSGSISPTSRTVSQGSTTSFTITAASGSTIASVSGCGGSLSGTAYTTGAISSGCTVTATFDLSAYTVTATAGSGGSISPGSVSVSHGSTTSFTVTPSSGYQISAVSGCNGSLSGATYTTGPVTASCTVSASFNATSVTPPPAPSTFTITTSVTGTGSGAISPNTATVNEGQAATFVVSPGANSAIEGVSGCGGSLNGSSYTTGSITSECMVTATFIALPQAQASSLTAYTDEAATGTLTGTSGSGRALAFRIEEQPMHGSISLNATSGAYEYQPQDGFAGADYFTFVVIDGALESEPARVDVEVKEWAGTVRMGNISNSPPLYSLASTEDGGFAVAAATSESLTGAAISDGSDLFLVRFDKHGHREDLIQLALPERQQSYQLLGSADGGYFLNYVSTLDLEGKQVDLIQRDINPDWTIDLSPGYTVAIPFTLSNPTFIGEIEIPGLTLNWNTGYLSDQFRPAIASDVNGAPGDRVDGAWIWSQTVTYTLDGDQIQQPPPVIVNFRQQFPSGSYWLLLSYVGEGAGFLLDSQVGEAPGVSTCADSPESCLSFSQPSEFSWTATNQGVGLTVRGIEGNYSLMTRGVLRLTREGAVAWNWIAPDGITSLYRMAVDRLGNLHVLSWSAFFSENSRLLIFNPQGVLLEDRVIEPQGTPPTGCEEFATVRSIAISELDEIILGGQVTRPTCPEGLFGGPFMMAYSQTGQVLWWLNESLPGGVSNANRLQYVVADSSGPLGFTSSEPYAIRVDSLGNLVGIRSLALDHNFFIGASNAAGEVLLFGETASGLAESDLKATKLSRAAAVDWSATISVTQPDGAGIWERPGNALLLDDGSALLLTEALGDLPNSPRISERDLVIIRVAPDGTIDY